MEALAVLWAPVRALSGVANERRVLLAFGVTALYAALSIVSSALAVLGGVLDQQMQPVGAPPLPPQFESFLAVGYVLALVFAVLSPFLFWLLVSGLMHLVTSFFGGRGPFSGTLAVVGIAQAPLVISAALAIPLTGLQLLLTPQGAAASDPSLGLVGGLVGLVSGLIGLAAFLWFAALVVIGSAFARRVGYGESAGSCAISCAGCLGLIIVVSVAVVALVAIVAGASGSTGA